MTKKRLVIFGTGQFAEMATYYIERDSQEDIAAYTVDRSFFSENSFNGRPVLFSAKGR